VLLHERLPSEGTGGVQWQAQTQIGFKKDKNHFIE